MIKMSHNRTLRQVEAPKHAADIEFSTRDVHENADDVEFSAEQVYARDAHNGLWMQVWVRARGTR